MVLSENGVSMSVCDVGYSPVGMDDILLVLQNMANDGISAESR